MLGIAACMSTLTGGTKLKKNMKPYQKHLSSTLLAGSIGVVCSVASLAVALAQEAEPKPQPPAILRCEADLRNAGWLKDILANVLIRAEHKPESEVRAFLK